MLIEYHTELFGFCLFDYGLILLVQKMSKPMVFIPHSMGVLSKGILQYKARGILRGIKFSRVSQDLIPITHCILFELISHLTLRVVMILLRIALLEYICFSLRASSNKFCVYFQNFVLRSLV